MLLLELFKGTGSVGKVFKENGWDVISLDIEKKTHPDIPKDILDWDYKSLAIIPDFIWASPPCNTFSSLSYPLKERDPKTALPKSDRAKLGTKILYRTLTIINYFRKKNPKLKYVIENPRGMMRNDKRMRKFTIDEGQYFKPNALRRSTTYYCNYEDDRTKATDFFSNFALNLNQTRCRGKVSVAHIPLSDRYKIPTKLVTHIYNQI